MTTTSEPRINPAEYSHVEGFWWCEYPRSEPRPVGWMTQSGRKVGPAHHRDWCNEDAHWRRNVLDKVNYLCDVHYTRSTGKEGDYNK